MATRLVHDYSYPSSLRAAKAGPAPVEAARVLVADDQSDVRYALCLLLKSAGYETATASGPLDVIAAIQQHKSELVLMDMNYTRDTTSGGEGLHLIEQIRELDAHIPILAMTAWGSIDLAVDAMRRGAADFVQKPWNTEQMLEKIGSLIQLQRNARKVRQEQEAEQGDAVEIQRRLLAFEAPKAEEILISGISRSLRFVGGDYCKVDRTGAKRYAVSIADVAGKGVPGAMLATSLRAAEKPLINQEMAPKQLCAALNEAMTEITPHGKFISFFFARLDLDRRTFTYCNAGHNPPMVISPDGSVRTLDCGGAVLGYFAEWNYEEMEVTLKAGDRIVLFTDGIVEAFHEKKGEFGTDRLANLARQWRDRSAEEMQRMLVHMVSEHCGGKFQDDATLVVIAIP